MAKQSTVKKVPAWGWETPNGKLYQEAYSTRGAAKSSAEYTWGDGFKIVRVWVSRAK